MSDYSMDIKGSLGLNEYSNIFDYLGIVDSGDNFIIKINKDNKQNINIINSMLKDNEFIISDEGYDTFGDYSINAYKQK
ncbi:hypothetical protein [Clostridium uliginosum]|uniref:Uncharacterized protein n=1 Tax=Clostridium uliginosum TaxID=119641 RepID=A0A1I1SUX1_9CLOT|nr:hypothetical protein [Clostridium uliginosum]SFD47703.1 hypothetical protein SAMN05421842_15511 [Clostridium uliginosum]